MVHGQKYFVAPGGPDHKNMGPHTMGKLAQSGFFMFSSLTLKTLPKSDCAINYIELKLQPYMWDFEVFAYYLHAKEYVLNAIQLGPESTCMYQGM